MDQNQQPVDDDLQKAIDDITNTTNVDPVFSDPIAAPSSIPEGDTGELDEPIGPFPEEPKVEMVAPTPEPIAPLQSTDIPELNMPSMPSEVENSEPIKPNIPEEQLNSTSSSFNSEPNQDAKQIKEAALRDLAPLLDHLNMAPDQKFDIYSDIIENLHDYSILNSAYKVAREIPDEKTRAESLFRLVEIIDKI